MAKFKSAWFVMNLWQTGNIGEHNIGKIKGQPEEGFNSHDTALAWMIDELGKGYYHHYFSTYAIMIIYEPTKPIGKI